MGFRERERERESERERERERERNLRFKGMNLSEIGWIKVVRDSVRVLCLNSI